MTSATKSKKTTKPISEIDQKIIDLAKSIVNSDSYHVNSPQIYTVPLILRGEVLPLCQKSPTAFELPRKLGG